MQRKCSGCDKDVRFDQDGSWAVTCSSCNALVLRAGGRAQGNMKLMPVLEDLSPMRVGSVGNHEGREFRITGRLRVESRQGYRNFWSLKGTDLPFTWLAHAYGNYALLRRSATAVVRGQLAGAKPAAMVELDGRSWIVEMLDNTFRYAWEGEIMDEIMLPWVIEVELGHAPADKAIVLVNEAKGIQCLAGVTIDFPELHFENAPDLARWI